MRLRIIIGIIQIAAVFFIFLSLLQGLPNSDWGGTGTVCEQNFTFNSGPRADLIEECKKSQRDQAMRNYILMAVCTLTIVATFPKRFGLFGFLPTSTSSESVSIGAKDIQSELMRAKEMHEQGLIDDEEYRALKEQILS